jgi:hypothetical protein
MALWPHFFRLGGPTLFFLEALWRSLPFPKGLALLPIEALLLPNIGTINPLEARLLRARPPSICSPEMHDTTNQQVFILDSETIIIALHSNRANAAGKTTSLFGYAEYPELYDVTLFTGL